MMGTDLLGICFAIALMVTNYNYNDSSSRRSVFLTGVFFCIVFSVSFVLDFILIN